MTDTPIISGRRASVLWGASVALLVASCILTAEHASRIRETRDETLPLAAALPDLERRKAFLAEQMDAAELHALTRAGSREERLHVFVLPQESKMDRMLGALGLLRDALERDSLLSAFSDAETGESVEDGEVTREPLTLHLTIHERGLETLLLFLRLTGTLSVADILEPAERDLLLAMTEEENPAGIVALEQFLSADLLSYAREPKPYEQQLLKAFSDDTFVEALHRTLRSTQLARAQELLAGPFGTGLQKQGLWPLQATALDGLDLEPGRAPGWMKATVRISLLRRGSGVVSGASGG